jgi:thymidylate synthase
MEIKGKNAVIVWKKVLKYLLENGVEITEKNNRLYKERLNIVTRIESTEKITDPIEILNSFKKWVYPTLEELKASVLEKNPFNRYYYDYGLRAFNFNGINQIDNYLIPLLKNNPGSKRGIVIFYTPQDSLPLKKETPGMISMHFNIINNKLHATAFLRSNDFFYGWPGNIVQTHFLAEYVAKKLNYPIGTLNTISVSAHIYEEQFEYIEKVLKHK